MLIILMSVNQWWGDLSPALQVFWFIAIIFSILFFIQFILLVIGLESDTDVGFEHGGDSASFEQEFSALSGRSIIAFFTFFGWTGVLTMGNQLSVWIAVLLSTLVGLAAMFIVAYLMFKFAQLEQSGTLNLYHALDQTGEVYLTVPPSQSGRGKVTLMIDGRVREMDAMTDGDTLKTGTKVRVIEILDENALKVEAMPEDQADTGKYL
ncbi:MAG: NfeD family protein [Saprospiraceae bacterium]|nr:NfeD family protein [Candidatus Opimibacter iunctus]